MPVSWTRSGAVTVKDGVTLAALVDLYFNHSQGEGETLLADTDTSFAVTPSITFTLEGDLFSYNADSDSYAEKDAFDVFIARFERRHAAEGWADYYMDSESTFLGPTSEARCHAKAAHCVSVIEHAARNASAALAALNTSDQLQAHALLRPARIRDSFVTDEAGERLCECSNCDWTGPESQAAELRDFWSRVETGGEIPAGDCPECESAFVYLVRKHQKLTLQVAAVDHRHGTNLYAAATEDALYAQLADYARESWSERFTRPSDPTPDGMADREVVRIYFQDHGDEWYVASDAALPIAA